MKLFDFRKWFVPMITGIVIGAAVAAVLFYTFSYQPPCPSVVPTQRISREDGQRFAKEYGRTLQPFNDYIKGYYLSSGVIIYLNSVLAENPGKAGIRLYPAMNGERLLAIMTLTDESGSEDAENIYVMENPVISPCPPNCDVNGPIYYPCPPTCDRE